MIFRVVVGRLFPHAASSHCLLSPEQGRFASDLVQHPVSPVLPLRLYLTGVLLPPCGPLLLALAPVPWSGVWGAPPLFCCSFPSFSSPPPSSVFTLQGRRQEPPWETILAQADDSDIAQMIFGLWRSLWKRATCKAQAVFVAKRRETALQVP